MIFLEVDAGGRIYSHIVAIRGDHGAAKEEEDVLGRKAEIGKWSKVREIDSVEGVGVGRGRIRSIVGLGVWGAG